MEAFKHSMVVSLQEVLESIDRDEVKTASWTEEEDEELDEIFRDISSSTAAVMETEQIYDINSKELAELHAVLDAEFEAVWRKHLAKKESQKQKDLAEKK
jgi:CTP-dependent riboflavin kinase